MHYSEKSNLYNTVWHDMAYFTGPDVKKLHMCNTQRFWTEHNTARTSLET